MKIRFDKTDPTQIDVVIDHLDMAVMLEGREVSGAGITLRYADELIGLGDFVGLIDEEVTDDSAG